MRTQKRRPRCRSGLDSRRHNHAGAYCICALRMPLWLAPAASAGEAQYLRHICLYQI